MVASRVYYFRYHKQLQRPLRSFLAKILSRLPLQWIADLQQPDFVDDTCKLLKLCMQVHQFAVSIHMVVLHFQNIVALFELFSVAICNPNLYIVFTFQHCLYPLSSLWTSMMTNSAMRIQMETYVNSHLEAQKQQQVAVEF